MDYGLSIMDSITVMASQTAEVSLQLEVQVKQQGPGVPAGPYYGQFKQPRITHINV